MSEFKIEYPKIDWAKIQETSPKALRKWLNDLEGTNWDFGTIEFVEAKEALKAEILNRPKAVLKFILYPVQHLNSKPYEITMWLHSMNVQVIPEYDWTTDNEGWAPNVYQSGIYQDHDNASQRYNTLPLALEVAIPVGFELVEGMLNEAS